MLGYKRPLPVTCVLLQITMRTGLSYLSDLKDLSAGYEELEYRDRHISRDPWTQHETHLFGTDEVQVQPICTGDSKCRHCQLSLVWAQTWLNCVWALPVSAQHTSSQLRCLRTHRHWTFPMLQAPGLMWKSELKYLRICQCGQDHNLPPAFCFSPSILHPKAWLSGAEAGHGQRLNQEGEKLTALAVSSSFFFLPSSIGTVLNYTKIACKALINLTCSNAAFPH